MGWCLFGAGTDLWTDGSGAGGRREGRLLLFRGCLGGGGRVSEPHLPECSFEEGSLSEYFDELCDPFGTLFDGILLQQRPTNMNSLLEIFSDVILDPP